MYWHGSGRQRHPASPSQQRKFLDFPQIHAVRDWFGWRWSWSQVHQFSSFDAMQGGGGGGAPVPASPVPAGGGSRYGPQPDTHAEVVAQARVCALQGWLSGRLRARGLRCHAARSGTGGVPDMGGWAPGGARAGAKEARYESGAAGASRPPVRAQLSVPRPRNQRAGGRQAPAARARVSPPLILFRWATQTARARMVGAAPLQRCAATAHVGGGWCWRRWAGSLC